MWGRMPQWNVSHTISNKLHAVNTNPTSVRAVQRSGAQRGPGSATSGAVASEWVVAGGIEDMKTKVRRPWIGPVDVHKGGQRAVTRAANETLLAPTASKAI